MVPSGYNIRFKTWLRLKLNLRIDLKQLLQRLIVGFGSLKLCHLDV